MLFLQSAQAFIPFAKRKITSETLAIDYNLDMVATLEIHKDAILKGRVV